MVLFAMSSLAASSLVWACILQVVVAFSFDGIPRPKGFPDAPTTAYGKFPLVNVSMKQVADCDWYGFANVNYPADVGQRCLVYTFKMDVFNRAKEGTLRPYEFIKCTFWLNSNLSLCYDTVWSNYYCTVGCFYLGNSSLPLPPVTALPPPSSPGAPGNTAPETSRSDAIMQRPSVVMVAMICAGVFAAVGLFNRW